MVNSSNSQVSSGDAASDRIPSTISWAVKLLYALLAAGAVTVLLIAIRQDDLITAWAKDNPATKEILETLGLQAVKDSSVAPPQFIPVAITLYVVMGGLVAIFAIFLRYGYEWARICLTLVLIISIVVGVAAFLVGQPLLFDICTVVLIGLLVVAMVPMWMRASTAFLHRPLEYYED